MVTTSASANHNLPAALTSFIGRDRELGDVRARLADVRLLTLVGVGGCGKTRLALEVARSVLDRYPDGVWLVELAPLADQTLVPHRIAAAVGVRETAGQSTVDALVTRLTPRRLLLLLDNCEHMLDACGQMVDALLRACPQLRVLATSREALGITGENAWRVPSLPVPDPQKLLPLAELRRNAAVQLFVDRAGASQLDFALTEHNAAAVAQVCARLDGIPLALELAAARMEALTPHQLATRLDQRFRLLTGGSRAVLPRQQTLRATLDWSYDLMSESERRVFNRLSVFAGGWTLEAAEAICAGPDLEQQDVLDLLAHLVRKCLVVADDDGAAAKRYRLLETLRQYGRELLAAAGEADALRRQHASYFIAFKEALYPDRPRPTGWLQGSLTRGWPLEQADREQDNLRVALRWWIDCGDIEHAVGQAEALFPIWYFRGGLTEGLRWLREILALPTVVDASAERDRILPMLGNLARRHGEYDVALGAFRELAATHQARGDRIGAAAALTCQANVQYLLANYEAADACLRDAKTTAAGLADAELPIDWLLIGGEVALYDGRLDEARALLEEVVATEGPASTLSGYCVVELGTLAREQGSYPQAWSLMQRGIEFAEAFGDTTQIAHCLEGFACLATAQGQNERALCLVGAAAALREATGAPIPPARRRVLERWLEVSRAALSHPAVAAAWHAGYVMPLKQAIAHARAPYALAVQSARVAAETVPAHVPALLTRREREVTALIAQGLTNRQIASLLVITDRTAAAHVEHILDKLGFSSRTQIGVWATEHGLVAVNRF